MPSKAPVPTTDTRALTQLIERSAGWTAAVRAEMARVVVGQEMLVDRLLIGLLTNGHILLEGVPGLAKTLTVKSLASCLSAAFQRIQFTPDLQASRRMRRTRGSTSRSARSADDPPSR